MLNLPVPTLAICLMTAKLTAKKGIGTNISAKSLTMEVTRSDAMERDAMVGAMGVHAIGMATSLEIASTLKLQ